MHAKELAFLVDQLSTTMWFFLDRIVVTCPDHARRCIECENYELCEAERNLNRATSEYLMTLRTYNKKLEVENNDVSNVQE